MTCVTVILRSIVASVRVILRSIVTCVRVILRSIVTMCNSNIEEYCDDV